MDKSWMILDYNGSYPHIIYIYMIYMGIYGNIWDINCIYIYNYMEVSSWTAMGKQA